MRFTTCVLVLVVSVVVPAFACLWDHDTLEMERQRFPSTLELITGKFLRHSTAFYEWRIRNRLERLKARPDNAELIDDLAVAYEKTGDHARAIEQMQQLERRQPGRYETAANLGTFYIHAGQLDEGLKWLDRALQINPDAHFGREKYQRLLVRYVQHAQASHKRKLSLADERQPSPGGLGTRPSSPQFYSFAQFITPPPDGPDQFPWLSEEDVTAAVKGTLGMMRFGNYDSPVLLEALGDLLREPHRASVDARQLAARAYLKASYEAHDPEAAGIYRHQAETVLEMQLDASEAKMSIETVESALKLELADAAQWYAQVEANERRWIAAGADVDAEFSRAYYKDPQVSQGGQAPQNPQQPWRLIALGTAIVVLCLVLTRPRLLFRR